MPLSARQKLTRFTLRSTYCAFESRPLRPATLEWSLNGRSDPRCGSHASPALEPALGSTLRPSTKPPGTTLLSWLCEQPSSMISVQEVGGW